MDPQFEELAQRLKSELATVVAEQFAAAESRLVGQYKIHAEEMKAEVKLAAEGYGATLEGIERSLKELAVKWDTKITDHDLVLFHATSIFGRSPFASTMVASSHGSIIDVDRQSSPTASRIEESRDRADRGR